jgi:hypothetical protein
MEEISPLDAYKKMQVYLSYHVICFYTMRIILYWGRVIKARRKKCPALEVVSYLLLGNLLQLPSPMLARPVKKKQRLGLVIIQM